MPASFLEILESRNFKFIVGEEEDGVPTELFVYEEAFAQLSPKLRALMQGSLQESQTACAVWEDISKETFGRFVQFAYTGDYSIPEGEKRSGEKQLEEERLEERHLEEERLEEKQLKEEQLEQEQLGGERLEEEQLEEERPNKKQLIDKRRRDITKKKGSKKVKRESNIFRETNDSLEETFGLQEMTEPLYEPVYQMPIGFGLTNAFTEVRRQTVNSGLSLSLKSKKKSSAWSPTSWKVAKEDTFTAESAISEAPPTQRDKYPTFAATNLVTNFSDLNFVDGLAPRVNYAATTEPSTTFNPDLNYSTILLAHAALYFAADYQQVDSLKCLSLYKLHKTLLTFIVDNKNISDIIDLVRFLYHKHEGDVGHELRNMVCQFVVVNALVLVFNENFMELLCEGGQFVKDFVRFEVQRKH
ncbi:hypothetical protein BGZ60DRAFT_520242 [Tricladium varicosporioides]|nr:hypothetical protein BGZ60DRAFT_520242 [Hymenoscyphus varicosporioides]